MKFAVTIMLTLTISALTPLHLLVLALTFLDISGVILVNGEAISLHLITVHNVGMLQFVLLSLKGLDGVAERTVPDIIEKQRLFGYDASGKQEQKKIFGHHYWSVSFCGGWSPMVATSCGQLSRQKCSTL